MKSLPQPDQELAVHVVRNIVGRVTYGLVGLDKLLQGHDAESSTYLRSFLSLFEASEQQTSDESRRLLPQVQDTLGLYNPMLKKELETAAMNISKLRGTSTNRTELENAYSQLEDLLSMLYEATAARNRISAR